MRVIEQVLCEVRCRHKLAQAAQWAQPPLLRWEPRLPEGPFVDLPRCALSSFSPDSLLWLMPSEEETREEEAHKGSMMHQQAATGGR